LRGGERGEGTGKGRGGEGGWVSPEKTVCSLTTNLSQLKLLKRWWRAGFLQRSEKERVGVRKGEVEAWGKGKGGGGERREKRGRGRGRRALNNNNL